MDVRAFQMRRIIEIGQEKGCLTIADIYRFFPPATTSLVDFLHAVDTIASAGIEIENCPDDLPLQTQWRS
ncbi:MAG TPA: hypothetical protein VED40_16910 [Azospirillaceae bacterium]|nr:hypothetical protein [Azospirillaceae bacterium]